MNTSDNTNITIENWNGATTTSTNFIIGGHVITESFKFIPEKNIIEVVLRKHSNLMYACNPPRPAPDSVWKEIYGVEDGKIKLLQTIRGIHTPTHLVPEQIKFEE